MSYTSNQYKYLLVKRLQRHFSMENAYDRAYTQSFFWKLFDESVTVTEESYNNFCRLMDNEIELCAQEGWRACDSIPNSAIEEQGLLLSKAFKVIGVDCKVSGGSSGRAKFTKPNGEVMEYVVTSGKNYFYINSIAGSEYRYTKASAVAYNSQIGNVPDGVDNPKIAGQGTYWSYNADTKTMTISGDGAYAGATNDVQLGSGEYTTVIFGANVSRLLNYSLDKSNIDKVVFLSPADAIITLGKFIASGSSSQAKNLVVYTDNKVILNYQWQENVNVTLHSLSEWEG